MAPIIKYTLTVIIFLSPPLFVRAVQWIQYPESGTATMTHYTLPEDYIASCGCTGRSTHYPTAALNQRAFGSNTSYGPACGRCFKLTLLNSFLSNPPYYPTETKSVVVKITDLCPYSTNGWCNGTVNGPNAGGGYLNFDLAFPSSSIPSDFFPSNVTLYGLTHLQDFGVWNISYQSVSCTSYWSGSKDAAALGSVPSLADGACCPADPTGSSNNTCPSFSDKNGTPPNTTSTGTAIPQSAVSIELAWTATLLVPLMYSLLR
ncbi:RlpA-like double-psi beta-barrel-protein domain-containing protein-containing protein [Russula brevipes]|nr:RlpA-like double-psi beta-barrel-protein domain-containing protein-containing protein [Russula brevipes]